MEDIIIKASAKIDEEVEKMGLGNVGQYISQHIIDKLSIPGNAQKVLDKKFKAAYEKMKSEAKKNAVSGCGVLSDEEGFEIIDEYYGFDNSSVDALGSFDLFAGM